MERRLAAILAADLVGYSRLIRADEEGTLAAFQALRSELIDPKIAAHNGRIFKEMGDGFLVEFASVVDGVRAAAEIQQAVAERNQSVPEDKRLVFRVGLNLGDVVIDGDDIHGDGINVASRLEGLAKPGGICISAKVYEEVRDRLDLAFEDMGDREVKNIDRPVRVWRWVAGGKAAAAGPATAEGPLPLPDKPSIAVLPFDNMSTDPEQEFFADGLSEDIITTLSKISNLFVIARNSSFVFKGQAVDVREVAGKLGVRYVLEGSVRAAGKRLRVTAQLVDAIDGGHLWADRFDRQMDDIFDIQDEIMREIVTALRIKMSDGEQAQIWLRGTDNVEAWSNAMQGVDLALQGAANTVSEGRRLLERAIAIDPEYATARAWIGFTHYLDGHFGYSDDPNGSLRQALEAANRALALDPGSVQGLMIKGAMEVQLELDANGIDTCRRAASLAPNDTFLKIVLARSLADLGELAEAEGLLREAMRLNPYCPIHYFGILANVLEMQGRDEEAMALLRRALAQNQDYFSGHLRLASLLGLAGRLDEAKRHAAEARRINPRIGPRILAAYYPTKNQAALQRFVSGLEAAGIDWS
jgi:adenylate cyclase